MTMKTPPDSSQTKSCYIQDLVLKNMDKAKQVKKMYKTPKHYEYDPSLNGLTEPGSNQHFINQALNDRMKALEAQNLALESRLKRLEAVLSSKHFLDFSSKLEEMTDKLDDLQSKIDLLDE